MKIKEIANSVDYAKNYKVILCDLWGVIHNGKQLFENSISFLREMKSNDIKIFFLSNAPRPNYIVEEFLNNKLGLNKNLYDGIITSGDIACNYINRKIHGESYFHLGPKKDYDLLEQISIEKAKCPSSSDFILCTGLLDDEAQSPGEYREQFEEYIDNNMNLICANPDEIVYRGKKIIPCAGSMANVYTLLGGNVEFYGKPYSEIYEHIYEILIQMKAISSKSEILAIGDSLKTDILGASQFEIDSILIQNGIHKEEINAVEDIITLSNKYLEHPLQEINTIRQL